MSEAYIRLPVDGFGKKVKAVLKPDGTYEEVNIPVERSICDIPLTNTVSKMTFGEDVNGNVREIKFYDGATLLFTLTFTNAGSVVNTWDIERS